MKYLLIQFVVLSLVIGAYCNAERYIVEVEQNKYRRPTYSVYARQQYVYLNQKYWDNYIYDPGYYHYSKEYYRSKQYWRYIQYEKRKGSNRWIRREKGRSILAY